MSWIGLRDTGTLAFDLRGLDAEPVAPPAGDSLPGAALLVEFRHRIAPERRNILRHAVSDGWRSGLTLASEPGGALALMQGTEAESRRWSLRPAALEEGETLVVTLDWSRRLFVLWRPDRQDLTAMPLTGLLPLAIADAARMLTDPEVCRLSPDVDFVALSDRPVPMGPLGGFNPQARVAVPGGQAGVADLVPGQPVLIEGGGIARVVWAGPVTLPARGLYAPLFLRAPYHGLTEDLLVSADIHLRLRGSDIEYLFGHEVVALAARHLTDTRSVIAVPPMPTVRYRQVALDRPGALIVNGLPVEPPGLSRLAGDIDRLALTVARGSAATFVAARPEPCPRLRDFEALTLRRLRAA